MAMLFSAECSLWLSIKTFIHKVMTLSCHSSSLLLNFFLGNWSIIASQNIITKGITLWNIKLRPLKPLCSKYHFDVITALIKELVVTRLLCYCCIYQKRVGTKNYEKYKPIEVKTDIYDVCFKMNKILVIYW